MKKTSALLTIVVACLLLVTTAHTREPYQGGMILNAKIYGVIETMPKDGLEGAWIIDGNTITVDSRTTIKQERGRAAIGSYVEVKGEQVGDKFTAYSIDVESGQDTGSQINQAKFYGTVEAIPEGSMNGTWRVNGRELLVTPNTIIKEKYGTAVVGSYVEVEGDFSGKTFTVYKIEVKDNKRHNSHRSYNSKFYGKIESMPSTGYEGNWTVAGKQVEVSNSTVIDERYGKASLGGEVKVKGVRSGTLTKAVVIKVTRSI